MVCNLCPTNLFCCFVATISQQCSCIYCSPPLFVVLQTAAGGAALSWPDITAGCSAAVLQCCSDVRPAKLVSWLARGCVRPGHHLLLARCDSEQTRWRRSGAWVCTARTSCSQHVTPTRHSYYSSRCKSVLCSAYCSKHTADTNPHKCHHSPTFFNF